MLEMSLMSILSASEVSLFDVNSWWWTIQKGLYWVIDAIQGAYNYLVGITPVNNTADAPNPDMMGDLLFSLFNDNRITWVWGTFMIFAVMLLLIFLVIGLVKVHFKNEDQLASRGKMVGKSFGAFFTMLVLPMIMFIAIFFVGYLMQFLAAAMNLALGNESGDMSIANIIHQICLPETLDPNDAKLLSSWDIDYSKLESYGVNSTYNYVLGMLSSGILIYVLITVCLTLVERLIDVVGLYLLAPFTLSRAPLDDGNSFNLWKDLVITRMISAGGIIIFMYLYFLLMGNVLTWFEPIATDSSTAVIAKNMVKILFVIGGAFSAKKGALMIAQMVSQNAGIAEGMSQQQSMQMLSSGLAMGSRALFTAMSGIGRGALMAAGGASNVGAAAARSTMANAGGAKIPANTGDGNVSGASRGGQSGSAPTSEATPGGAPGGAPGGNGGEGRFMPGQGADPLSGANSSQQAQAPTGDANIPVNAGNDGGLPGESSQSFGGEAQNSNSGFSEGSSAFQNPNLPGKAGEIARVNRGFGSAREAMLYGGMSGLAGYGLAKGIGAVASVISRGSSALGGKIKSAYAKTDFAKNRAAMKEARGIAKGVKQEKKASEKQQKREKRQNDKIMPKDMTESQMKKSLDRDQARVDRVNAKIQKKYGKLGGSVVERMQAQANRHRLDLMDAKIKKFKSNSNVSDALSKKFEEYGRNKKGTK